MADFYGTATGFRGYHIARGRDVSTYADDAIVNASLLVASEWLDGKYRSKMPGLKVGMSAQIREYPRVGGSDIYGYAIPSDRVPVQIEYATYEAALRNLATPGALLIDYTPNKYKRASVDGAVSVEYASFDSASDAQTQFSGIDMILSPILTAIGGDLSNLSGSAVRV